MMKLIYSLCKATTFLFGLRKFVYYQNGMETGKFIQYRLQS